MSKKYEKECPECGTVCHSRRQVCTECDYVFYGKVKSKKKEKKTRVKPKIKVKTKTCPDCFSLVPVNANFCADCKYDFNKPADEPIPNIDLSDIDDEVIVPLKKSQKIDINLSLETKTEETKPESDPSLPSLDFKVDKVSDQDTKKAKEFVAFIESVRCPCCLSKIKSFGVAAEFECGSWIWKSDIVRGNICYQREIAFYREKGMAVNG